MSSHSTLFRRKQSLVLVVALLAPSLFLPDAAQAQAAVPATAAESAIARDLIQVTQRKLSLVTAATTLEALRVPPNNRLEALKADRLSQYSIRINDQYRICFTWNEFAEEIEIVDYH
jgi:toxin HigB-1